jgi:hypothetical protein
MVTALVGWAILARAEKMSKARVQEKIFMLGK